jgi:hypothetical protein
MRVTSLTGNSAERCERNGACNWLPEANSLPRALQHDPYHPLMDRPPASRIDPDGANGLAEKHLGVDFGR